jgi:hypothetical protein
MLPNNWHGQSTTTFSRLSWSTTSVDCYKQSTSKKERKQIQRILDREILSDARCNSKQNWIFSIFSGFPRCPLLIASSSHLKKIPKLFGPLDLASNKILQSRFLFFYFFCFCNQTSQRLQSSSRRYHWLMSWLCQFTLG